MSGSVYQKLRGAGVSPIFRFRYAHLGLATMNPALVRTSIQRREPATVSVRWTKEPLAHSNASASHTYSAHCWRGAMVLRRSHACQRCRSLNDGRALRGSRSELHLKIAAALYALRAADPCTLTTLNFRRRHRDHCHRARCQGAPCCVRLYANYLKGEITQPNDPKIYRYFSAGKKLAAKITSRRQSCFNPLRKDTRG